EGPELSKAPSGAPVDLPELPEPDELWHPIARDWYLSLRESGQPLGVQHPAAWVQIAAVSQDQTRNTMTLFPSILSKRAIEE
ncbi:hypothetical protein KBZ21_40155, partial [Streptomyces sp. A73]|nr:hypothetical protein [Streptomyces sp. A73]